MLFFRTANPCDGDVCGQNSKCAEVNGFASCSCSPGAYGIPPNCRTECSSHSDCPSTLACANKRCDNPCKAGCGINAECHVINHIATCNCIKDHIGNALVKCSSVQTKTCILSSECGLDMACIDQQCVNPCIGSCASKADCRVEFHTPICSCPNGYSGDPFIECIFNRKPL